MVCDSRRIPASGERETCLDATIHNWWPVTTRNPTMPPTETEMPSPLLGLDAQIELLRETGADFHRRGWSLGTSSNYSIVVRREPLELLITASGMDKGRLQPTDFVRIGASGRPLGTSLLKSSAETLLHLTAAENSDVGAVLHTHSVWGTLLSDLYHPQGGFAIEGFEMLKGLAGVTTHQHSTWVEIFDNTQEIPQLAQQVRARLNSPTDPLTHGYLIHRHGLYTWGRDLLEARRHVEIFEFLFECVARRLILTGSTAVAGATT